MLGGVQHMGGLRGYLFQRVKPRLQPLPGNRALGVGGALIGVSAGASLGQREGHALHRLALGVLLAEGDGGELAVGKNKLGVLVGFQLHDPLGIIHHIAGAELLGDHIGSGG